MNSVAPRSLAPLAELHQVRLIRFSVDPDEVQRMLPGSRRARLMKGRAHLSFLQLELRRKHPLFAPQAMLMRESYAAFLLELEAKSGTNRPELFHQLQAFSDKPPRALATANSIGSRPTLAIFQALDTMLELRAGESYLNYALDPKQTAATQATLPKPLSTVYAHCNPAWHGKFFQPEQWRLRQVDGYLFETNFFNTAAFLDAFVVDAPLRYDWSLIQTTTRCVS